MMLLQTPTSNQPVMATSRSALEKLADVSVPAPISWMPQTWGWVALAVLALALATWLTVRLVRRRVANRYRVEALADLAGLEAQLGDDARRPAALAALPSLVKRVALAAWPRPDVASLSGPPWIAFLRAHAGRGGLPEDAAGLLADGEYRPQALEALGAPEARRIIGHVRHWIEGHRVRP